MIKVHSQMEEKLADTVTLSASSTVHKLGPNVTIASGYSNSAITNNGVVTGSTYTGPFTISSATGISNAWVSPKLKLDGEGADIEVNGVSLIGMLDKIQERLNILTPDPKLEAEWEELRALGEQYRRLEQHIKDKQATWNRLKATQSVQSK